ncbi:MAG: hypothetical protein JW755_06515 [Candidatus Aminicenantes bacterium]|nr:hypothetical protein [Candidatus Aminicenantes bacterium]
MDRKTTLFILLFIFIFSLGFSFFVNLKSLKKNFLFADEAIYYSLTQSLAQDNDIEYDRIDLIRYYREWETQPLGIFLKKGKEGKIFYAKSFAYPLFAAPFVKIFGSNGFFVFHSCLLFFVLYTGFLFFSLFNKSGPSFLIVFTFIFASVTYPYFLWISPDFFNFSLVFLILFFWLYKYAYKEGEKRKEERNGRLHNFLLSDWSDYLAALLVSIAVFSKPPNIILMGPLVLITLLKKRLVKAFLMVLIFVAATMLFWGSNQLITGEWNYQGGERKTFYGPEFPLEKEEVTFDSVGNKMTSDKYAEKHLFLSPHVYFYNLFYYFFGRFTGMAWFFFPALLALILFFFRRKHLYQWLLFASFSAEILIYIFLMPDNYAGGGGALANRYFLNIYPLAIFLPGLKRDIRESVGSWIAASIFIAPILISPLQHSHYPATHAKQMPFKRLPVEMTLINNLPTNTNTAGWRQTIGTKYSWLHFLDDNFHPRTISIEESNGFFTRGTREAEMILKTYYPVKKMVFHLRNNPRRENKITVKVGRQKKEITLGKLQRGTLTFDIKDAFKLSEWLHLYKIRIKASKGSIPFYEEEFSTEMRYLGVWFELELITDEMPE